MYVSTVHVKIPLTVLVRALDLVPMIRSLKSSATAKHYAIQSQKDLHKKRKATSRTEEGLKDVYERLRPGEPKTADSSRNLLNARFFDPNVTI